MTEDDLVLQLRLHNEAAFKWLVEAYKDKIFNSVFNILQDSYEAEDATQETFIQVFASIHLFKQHCALSTWIHTIAIRKALEKLRKQKVKQKINNLLALNFLNKNSFSNAVFDHPGIALENKEKAAILFKAMASLPEKQKIAFSLIKVEGLSYTDASNIMLQSIKAIESLVSRAKVNLQKKLVKYHT